MSRFAALVVVAVCSIAVSAQGFLDSDNDKSGLPISAIDKQKINDISKYISYSSCDYYLKYQEIFSYCSDQDYVLAFGHHYCGEYLKERNNFENKEWNDEVRHCLEASL